MRPAARVAIVCAALCAAACARGESLGTIGPTYPIAEQNLLDFIMARLREKERSGELQRMEDLTIESVSLDESQSQLTLFDVPDRPGISASIFEAIASENILVDMIVQSTGRDDLADVSFTVGAEQQKDGSWISFGVVSWSASADPFFDMYEVQYRLHAGPGPWVSWRCGPASRAARSGTGSGSPSILRSVAEMRPPRSTSVNSSGWPSASPVSPACSTAEMWTKTSSPPSSRTMKPKPFCGLKNFTMPLPWPTICGGIRGPPNPPHRAEPPLPGC